MPIERAKRAALEQSLLTNTRVPLGFELRWRGEHEDRLDHVYMVRLMPIPSFPSFPSASTRLVGALSIYCF